MYQLSIMFQLVFGQIIIILLLLYMVRRDVFHKVLDLLTFPSWMEYEQKPFIFQDKVSALLIDNSKATELGIWVSFF